METTLLHELSLLYIDSLDFKDNCYSVYIKADNGPKEFLIVLNNILSFNYSVDSLDDETDHSFNVLDIFHEYRKPYNSDLKSHVFFTEDALKSTKLHIINIHGSGKVYNFICKEVKVLET